MAGILTNIRPGRLSVPSQDRTPEAVLILGTAVDGPIDADVRVDSYDSFRRMFGPADYKDGYKDPNTSAVNPREPNGATLPRAVYTALQEGLTNIYVRRITGSYATHSSAFGSKLDIRSIYPGRIYNEVTVSVTPGSGSASGSYYFDITQPAVKGGLLRFTLPIATKISTLIDRVNSNPNNRTIIIDGNAYASSLTSAITALSSGSITLAGGTNGTDAPGEDYSSNKYGIFNTLTAADTGVFQQVLDSRRPYDMVILTGLYVDDECASGDATKSIFNEGAVWARELSRFCSPTRLILGTRPCNIRDYSTLVNYYNNSLLATSTGYYNQTLRWTKAGAFLYSGVIYTNGNVTDNLARRVVVVAGPDVIYEHPDIGQYMDTPHVTYGAMSAITDPVRSTTFKSPQTIKRWNFAIPGNIANKLAAGVGWDGTNAIDAKGAYVCFIQSTRRDGSLIVAEDVTAAFRNDIYLNEQILHVVNRIVADVSESLRSFISEPGNPRVLAAMSAAVKNVLKGYDDMGAFKESGEGLGYTYNVSYKNRGEQIGVVSVDMSLNIARAIRVIEITAEVTE